MTFWIALPSFAPLDVAGSASPIPYVWVGNGPPPASAAAQIADWARTRGLVVGRRIAREAPSPAPASLEVGEAVEAALERSREASTSGDRDKALRELDDATAALDKAPHLPHATWLRAELLRARAALLPRSDAAIAKELLREADALAGARWSPTKTADADTPIDVEVPKGIDGRVELRVDARVVEPPTVRLGPGKHHVAAYAKGELRWGAFFDLAANAKDGRLPAPPSDLIAPCSEDDFDATTADADGPKPASGVSCPRWIMVGESGGALVVALCREGQCGAFAPAHRTEKLPPAPTPGEASRPFPAWVKWTLVGVGVVGVGFATAALAGVFAPRQAEDRFVGRGVRVE